MKKNLLLGGLVAVLVIIGVLFYESKSTQTAQAPATPGTISSGRQAFSVTMAPLTASATTTTIVNNTSFDRAIIDVEAYCQGVGTSYTYPNTSATGLANLLAQIATTSVSGLGLQGNTNYVGNLTISTTTPLGDTYTGASTTTPYPTDVSRIWPAGTGLSFTFNATNTAACTISGSYLNL